MVITVAQAIGHLKKGKIIAYPTEAVYGLGCDPENENALLALLNLKKRDPSKGLILIASHISQILPYLDLSTLAQESWQKIIKTWPGPYTWVFPAKNPKALFCGQKGTLAVRVTAHETARNLCESFGKALVSTSANVSGRMPSRHPHEIADYFGDDIAGVVEGNLGTLEKPTSVIDALTEEVYR